MKLANVAKIVRSKNAGPFKLTFDIIFDGPEALRRFLESNSLEAHWVSRRYGVSEDAVQITPFPPGNAIKITIPRAVACGSPEDTDIHGAQQHVPLLELEIRRVDSSPEAAA